jgi:hypothetical protein
MAGYKEIVSIVLFKRLSINSMNLSACDAYSIKGEIIMNRKTHFPLICALIVGSFLIAPVAQSWGGS